jgi:hypothetical protein
MAMFSYVHWICTNNPLENFNGDFKKTYTNKQRYPLKRAVRIVSKMIKTESFLLDSNSILNHSIAQKKMLTIGKRMYLNGKLRFSVLDENSWNLRKSYALENTGVSRQEQITHRFIMRMDNEVEMDPLSL